MTIRRRYYNGTVRATKNHRFRTLELPTMTLPTLERLVPEVGEVEPIPPLGDREHDVLPFLRCWLIQTATGRPASNSAFGKALAEACAAAGVPRLSSHGLRHTYVSWMVDDGHTADKIACWIGDTPTDRPRRLRPHARGSSAPAAASIDAALDGLG